jgi:hypothetical protein
MALSYELFLSKEEISLFELDMEIKEYKRWTEKYPEHLVSIFATYLTTKGNEVSREDVEFFVKKGVDLNEPSEVYGNFTETTTILNYACAMRHNQLVEALIYHGANVNLLDPDDNSPLEATLIGQGYGDTKNIQGVMDCVEVLVNSGAEKEICEFTNDEFFGSYWKIEGRVKEFLKTCKIKPFHH